MRRFETISEYNAFNNNETLHPLRLPGRNIGVNTRCVVDRFRELININVLIIFVFAFQHPCQPDDDKQHYSY